MTRVLLVNKTLNPTREHLKTVDRQAGDAYFASLGLEWGGYIISEGDFRLAAQWMVPADKVETVLEFLKTNPIQGYTPKLFRKQSVDPVTNEERIF